MHYSRNKNQRGAALIEFAIVATVFFTVIFGVLEAGRLLWTHNALRDATRRGARYATLRQNDTAGQLAVQKMVVYGDPNANPAVATPVVAGLTTGDVAVAYSSNFNGLQLSSKATVSVPNYQFRFAVPFVGGTLTMPVYKSAMPGESNGYAPCDNPAVGTPLAPCNIIPN